MIIQHLSDENTNKKLDPCVDNKIQSNLLRFLRQHNMCFTEPEQNFLNNKQREVSNYCGVPKIHIFTTNQQTQNDMSHLRQITHPVV